LTIALSSRRGRDLVELTGVLDYASVPYLRHVVFGLLDERRCRITIDVSRLRILDAASINVVLYLRDRARQLGGDLQLTGATGAVLTALEITGVAKQLGPTPCATGRLRSGNGGSLTLTACGSATDSGPPAPPNC